jgi:Lar family restriction alleviation protein
MTEKLKPCPFCGGEAELLSMTYRGGKVFGVFCKTQTDHGHFIDNYASKQEAIDAWNRRAYEHD